MMGGSIVPASRCPGHGCRNTRYSFVGLARQRSSKKRTISRYKYAASIDWHRLLDNAVKYGKAANMTIQTTPKTIEVIIDDEGPGIPEQELSRVFEPFYRLEESRSRETGGVGLGLAIAQSIVQAHRGELVLSNRPTGGLRARIVLPR